MCPSASALFTTFQRAGVPKSLMKHVEFIPAGKSPKKTRGLPMSDPQPNGRCRVIMMAGVVRRDGEFRKIERQILESRAQLDRELQERKS